MSSLRNRRTIIDRRALTGRAVALIDEHGPGSAALRPALLAVFKDALAAGQDEVRRRFFAGASGEATVRARAFLIDQIIRTLYDLAAEHLYPLRNPTAGEHLSVIAVGGYGRGELAPFSDIDLLFLCPYKQTPWGEQVVEYMLYMLWDLGLKVGHATRWVDESLRLARSDLTIRTALLEARYLWGDPAPYREFVPRFAAEVVAGSGPEFVEAKLAERSQRHDRMGGSRYVVEPNVKEGKGGLRDLHTLFWIAKYLYRVEDISELVKLGVLTAEEYRRFVKAQAFLWTVRCHLHYLAGRAEERLTFDAQPELARRLNYADRTGASGVERFMKHYFLVAKDIGDLTRIFCAALEAEHQRRPRLAFRWLGASGREIDGFVIDGERLTVVSDDAFATDPIKLIRLFRVAQTRDLDIHPNALRLVRRNLGLIDARLRADPEANRLFLDMLTSEHDPETTLRRLNEAGVLGRFIPDFGRVVAQMQHDMYHVYTVDEHTIRAIGVLARIEAGALAEEHPLSDEIVHKVLSRQVLYLAVLLHDIAKGRSGDHSVLGAEVALRLAPRLGLGPSETEAVAWLVRNHLLMSATAFKRDLTDAKTAVDFVEHVQSPERLRQLLVLTVADIRAVGPGVWNGWKGQLLRELYYQAEEILTGGHVTAGREQRVQAAKADLRARLADWNAAEIDAHLERGYDSYWLSTDTDTHERHARMMRDADRRRAPLAIETRTDRFRSITELTLYTADHPGLFAQVAGAMAVSGASIVKAKIHTTVDGMALDTFVIQDAEGGPYDRPDRLARLSATIERTLSGDLRPTQALAARASRLPRRTDVFKVEPLVLIDNNASRTRTVIEVNGRDRAGLLYDVTRALFDLNLSISSAHIETYGERAVDVFYVKDLYGLKITSATKLKAIEKRLLEALAAPTSRAPGRRAAGPRGRAETAAAE